jgi:hypothetical protein
MFTDWDYGNVRDFEWLTNQWDTTHALAEPESITDYINFLGKKLMKDGNLEIANLDPAGSRFFKTVYQNTPRIIRKR